MPFFTYVFHWFYRTAIVPTFIDIVPLLINIVPTNNLFLLWLVQFVTWWPQSWPDQSSQIHRLNQRGHFGFNWKWFSGIITGKILPNDSNIFNPTWCFLSSPSPHLECFYSIRICQRPTYQSFSLLKLTDIGHKQKQAHIRSMDTVHSHHDFESMNFSTT